MGNSNVSWGTKAQLCELADMAMSREKILLWRDHLHIILMMRLGPVKLSTFGGGGQLEDCRAGSTGSNVSYLWLG